MKGLTRRQALHLAATAAAAAGTTALGVALVGRKPGGPARLFSGRDHRVARPGGVELAIAHGSDAAANVRAAVAALGGMAAFVRPGDRVAIKPNVGWNRLPEQAADTSPEVVTELVRLVRSAGAAKVWVTDSPVNDAERCFTRSGIRRAVLDAGATLVLPDAGAFRDAAVGGLVVRVAEVLWPLLEADKVLNVPIAKQHGLTGATLSMKNWYGIVGGQRARLHQDIHRAIVDLAAFARPTLTVLDATRVLLRNGPSGGSPDDVAQRNTVAASTDQVALDAFGAGLLGLSPGDLGCVVLGERAGLGRADWKSLRRAEIAG
jgi:uncharacterized protein (DUF362 family)